MKRRFVGIAIAVLVAAAEQLARADDEVGPAGDPATWEIVGSKTYTGEEIRDGLIHDPEMQRAMSPSANRYRMLNLIEEKIASGYRTYGFIKPEVVASSAASGGVRIEIKENQKVLPGDFQIIAPAPLDAEKFKAHFLVEDPGRVYRPAIAKFKINDEYETPILKSYEQLGFAHKTTPIKFDTDRRKAWRWAEKKEIDLQQKNGYAPGVVVAELAANEGYFAADVSMRVEKTADNRANIIVSIDNLGPKAVVGKIDVKGLKINTAEKLAAFLNCKTGSPITLKDLCDYQMRLRWSGRFLKHELSVTPTNDGKLDLTFELEEVAGVSPLDEPLSQADQVGIKFSRWAEGFEHGEDELVDIFNLFGISGEIISNPKNGFIATLEWGKGTKDSRRFHLMISPKEASFESETPAVRFFAPQVFRGVMYEFGLKSRQYSNSFQAGYWNSGSPMKATLNFPPAEVLYLIHEEGITTSFKDGELTIVSQNRRMVIEAKTGRLMSLRKITEEGGNSSITTRGRFEKAAEEIQKRAVPNAYDEKFPFGSFVSGALVAGADKKLTPEDQKSLHEMLRKTFCTDAMESVGSGLRKSVDVEFDKFTIPVTQQTGLQWIISRTALPAMNASFEYGSWPWTLSRETIFVNVDSKSIMPSEIDRVVADKKLGPLGYLFAAILVEPYNDDFSNSFAERGLSQLKEEAIAADLAKIFLPGKTQTAILHHVLESFSKLDEKEFAILARAYPDVAPALKAIWEMTRTTKPDQRLQAIAKLLAQPAAKSWLEGALKRRLTVH